MPLTKLDDDSVITQRARASMMCQEYADPDDLWHAYWYTDLRGEFLAVERRKDLSSAAPPIAFSGSTSPGWQSPQDSDLILAPAGLVVEHGTGTRDSSLPLVICDVRDGEGNLYEKCPRTLFRRLQETLKTRLPDIRCLVGVELEFHLFDSVTLQTSQYTTLYQIEGADGAMVAGSVSRMTHPSLRQRSIAGDRFSRVRSDCAREIETAGIAVHAHGHEDGLCQHEISLKPLPLQDAADAIQASKLLVKRVAHRHGLIATFVPKPLANDPGSGLHLSLSLWRDQENLFYAEPHQLSPVALAFSRWVQRHIKALNALLNPTSNSYNRLFTSFDQRVDLMPQRRGRHGPVRTPPFFQQDECRIEFRFPDAMSNPYLGIAGLVLAGIEGMEQISNEDETSTPGCSTPSYPRMCHSLLEAAEALADDNRFLSELGVFTPDLIRCLADLARRHYSTFSRYPNPAEFHAIF